MHEQNPSIRTATTDGITSITLNRPERYNAMTVPMMRRFYAALTEADADSAVRCIILRAEGTGFCTGQDLGVLAKQHEHQGPEQIGEKLRREYNPVTAQIAASRKPVIAAIQGVAAGAGWSVALACDLRIAARSARFVPAFAKLGLVPGMGGTAAIVESAGYARAMEYLLIRDELCAEEAQALGLVNTVVDDAELASTALAWAQRIASLPPEGVAQTKRLLREIALRHTRDQLDREAWVQTIAAGDPRHRELVAEWSRRRS
ncbi:MAG: enoyl-CoA hydratase/isomerase family protein [Phycisphaerales bacterium]|nr:enoyl-CoA hydratase/isomerase family protein [Phycisphaerales bacterium]